MERRNAHHSGAASEGGVRTVWLEELCSCCCAAALVAERAGGVGEPWVNREVGVLVSGNEGICVVRRWSRGVGAIGEVFKRADTTVESGFHQHIAIV